MSITGKIKTLFSDKNKTEALFPRTKVSAVSDDNGVGLNVLLEQTVPMTRGGTGAENGAEGLANLFAAGNTVLSPYQYGTELPANAAVGQVYFEEATGTIADIGQDVAKALRAVNLLDNSDFRNPVNQRGLTVSRTDYGDYMIDRWICDNSSVGANGIVLAANANAYMVQRITSELKTRLMGKAVTLAFCVNGGVRTLSFVMAESNNENINGVGVQINGNGQHEMYIALNNSSVANTIQWAALYEGEYTAETLPPYVPKGYGAELAECQRYYQKVTGGLGAGVSTTSGSVLVFVPLPVSMRLAEPTVTFINSLWAYTHTGSAYSLTYKSCLANQNGIRLDCASNGSTNYPVNVPDINIALSADL